MAGFLIDSSVKVMLGERADAVERTAAEELTRLLGQALGAEMPHYGLMSAPDGMAGEGPEAVEGGIVLGTPASSRLVRLMAGALGLLEVSYDGFVITPHQSGRETFLIIASTEPKGVLNGVYHLLEAIGCDFTLAEPRVPSIESFTVAGEMREVPRFAVRAMSGPVEYLARNRINAVGYGASMSMVYLDDFPRLGWRSRWGGEIETERGRFGDFLASAREFGMRVYLSGVEHWWPDELLTEYPEFAHPDTGHVFCPSQDNWLLFARSRLEELLRSFDGIWGYRLTLADICRATPFAKCAACGHIGSDERLREIVRELGEAASAAGTRLILRTWGMDCKVEAFRDAPWSAAPDWDPVTALFRLDGTAPSGIVLETKNAWGDDIPELGSNPWLSEFPERDRIASFDAFGAEHRGCNLMPCSAVEAMRERMIEIGAAEVHGVLATGELPPPDELRLGERLGMLNALAFCRLAWDPACGARKIHSEWARAEFPECADEMASIMHGTYEPMTKALMIRSQPANFHSGVPGSLEEVGRRMSAYGFNDRGARLDPSVLVPSSRNADAAVREKNEAVVAYDQLLERLGRLGSCMDAGAHAGLVLLFEFARDYAKLWRLITEAHFLIGMMDSGAERPDRCIRRLGVVSDALVEGATLLPDNSEMALEGRLWRRDRCPALTRNIRQAVRMLVERDLKPRLGADAPVPGGPADLRGETPT